MVLEKIRGLFSSQPLNIQEEEELAEKFREEKDDELEELDEKAEDFREDITDVLDELESDLEDLRDFEDERAVIEDNVSNIVGGRLRLLEEFSAPESIEEFHSELEEFLEEFNKMGRKEKAVLDEAKLQEEFSDSLRKLTELYEDLDSFTDEDYGLRRKLDELEQTSEELEGIKKNIEEKQEEIEELEVGRLEDELEEKRDEISELGESDLSQDFKELNHKLKEKEKEVEKLEKKVSKAVSRSERGLKKLLHEGKIQAEKDQLEVLEDIRDGEVEKLLDRPKKVEKAAKEAEESLGDFLGDKTREKLQEGLEKLKSISDTAEKLEEKKKDIEELEQKHEDHEFQHRMEELEKREEALEETGDEELAKDEAFHDFQIPEDYRYEKALEQTENVDQFLNEAFDALEAENPEKLENIFRVNFVNADGIDHDTLHRMLEHLDTKNMSLERVKPDILGEAYMDLVRDFAESEGKDGGQFFTPQEMVQLMVKVLNPENGDGTIKVYDPTVGSAGMLVEMAEHYRGIGDPKKDLLLKGQEINPGIAPIARMNLFLHDLDGEITREDSLANPQFTQDGELEKFDYVLANPPFSADWQKDACQDDKYNRFEWGMARADRADYAFIQHMIASLNEEGKMACVIPHGVLFRKHESKFREPMLENDMVEAVIGLPENLFQNNSIPSGILVVNKDKPSERKGQVQFIHAADENFYEELSNQNKLTENGIQEIVEKYRNWETEERVSRVVDLEEIRENDYNLNIALYVDTTEPEEDIDVSEELEKLHQLQEEREEIENQMQEHMEALNYE